MKHFKIITMGILASILSLLGCGYGNKRATQSESINPYIPVAAQITMDKLPGVLKNVKAGRTEYDFTGICANGVDCIYFMQDNGKFYIDFEAMSKDQLPYLDTLKQFAKEHNYTIIETTYNNTPIDYDHYSFIFFLYPLSHYIVNGLIVILENGLFNQFSNMNDAVNIRIDFQA